jgi:uncharacterized membrane protein
MFYSIAIILAALIGFSISFYIHRKRKRQEPLVCFVGANCNAVIYSRYAATFGIPNQLAGMFYYGIVALAAGAVTDFPSLQTPALAVSFKVLTAGAALFSCYLVFVQLYFLKEWCEWCFTSAALSIIIFLLTFSFLSPKNLQRVQPEQLDSGSAKPVNFASERKLLAKRLDQATAEQVYAELNTEYAARPFAVQHMIAHIFGELLYEKKGVSGIVACNANFAFGCYHSFFMRAIGENGLQALESLDKECANKFGLRDPGCQHGIGHGILEYMGHYKLRDALNACALIQKKPSLSGCTSGVFMEYNVPIILTATSSFTQLRPFDIRDPYQPCPSLLPEFQLSCYHELSQWWDKFVDYRMIGKFCHAISPGENRESCFRGAGKVAAPSSFYDVLETKEKCAAMPDVTGIAQCSESASWSFFAEPRARDKAPLLCADLDASVQKQCAPGI